MTQTTEAVTHSVLVPLEPGAAFELFTDRFADWWPKESHHIGEADAADVFLEPREGGRWYTRHTDGSETSTGYVAAWEPPDRLVVTWQISAGWAYDPSLVTTVEVRFVEEAPDRTRVELEHRDLDRFGPDAERMRQVFAGPDAWNATLVAYAAAVEA